MSQWKMHSESEPLSLPFCNQTWYGGALSWAKWKMHSEPLSLPFCNQTWYGDTLSWAGGRFLLNHSRSFFVTKLSMVVRHHGPKCHAKKKKKKGKKKKKIANFKFKVTVKAYITDIFTWFYYTFWTKPSVMVGHHKPKVSSENIRLLCSWSRTFKISVVCLDTIMTM